MSVEPSFKIAIIGLGLMGGSFAYALRGFRNCVIAGYDLDSGVSAAALEKGAIDIVCTSPETAADGAGLVMFCSSPGSIVENMKKCLPHFKNGAVITDICGVKTDICAFVSENLPERVDYIGLHPMAGRETGGFVNADPKLFNNAGFIIILPDKNDYNEESLGLIKDLSVYVGAGRIVVNAAAEHDRIIAYTSGLMHIAAAALVVEYPEDMTMAHTAGAFRDCTRIAKIDAAMWTELLSLNSRPAAVCLGEYIESLNKFKTALERGDKDKLKALLQRAHDNKEYIQNR